MLQLPMQEQSDCTPITQGHLGQHQAIQQFSNQVRPVGSHVECLHLAGPANKTTWLTWKSSTSLPESPQTSTPCVGAPTVSCICTPQIHSSQHTQHQEGRVQHLGASLEHMGSAAPVQSRA